MKNPHPFLFVAALQIIALGLFSPSLSAVEKTPLMLGSAWYPEQWPEARWDADLALMEAAGFRMVRIGEFAWSSIEPSEGRFDLDWMERAINAAGRHKLAVVIGTPTDTPPAWLTSKYPETLRIDDTGRQLKHGGRRQFSYASAKYRELCGMVVSEMARRFGHNPNVIGWQIGNEYTDDSTDPDATRAFHSWLKNRHQSLDTLNTRWMTSYWSQTYTSWDQIPVGNGPGNPGLMLDYKRFVTDQWRAFQRVQIDAIRAQVAKDQFITTNLGGLGWANRFNREQVCSDLDFITWDNYVGQGHIEPYRNGATHDLVRGWKQRNFWVMEIQPAYVNWAPVSNALDKGETRALVWSAIGHGADCVAYWQWRSGLNGQEQYHGALVGPEGDPLPFYEEARQTGEEMLKVGSVLEGTSPQSQVALLHDYDSRWAIDFQKHSERYDQLEILIGYYRALRDRTQSVDIVAPTAPLGAYKLVVAPSLNVISKELAAHLRAYVEQGGHLILGPRSGMKDEFNSLNPERQPGPLLPALGARVEQFYALLEEIPVAGPWGTGKALIWAEQLSLKSSDAEVALRYGSANGWLDGQPAAVTRRQGKGSISYLGAVLDPELLSKVSEIWLHDAGVDSPTLPVPAGIEVNRRVGKGHEVYILINLSKGPQRIALPHPMQNLLNDGSVSTLDLPRFGVSVLSRKL